MKRSLSLPVSEHFTIAKTTGDRWQVTATNVNDDIAARAMDVVGKEHRGDLTATTEQNAKMLVWELDEQYERAWHGAAWRRYSKNLMTRQLDLPEPIRKSRQK